jgi:hypothetical protein
MPKPCQFRGDMEQEVEMEWKTTGKIQAQRNRQLRTHKKNGKIQFCDTPSRPALSTM